MAYNGIINFSPGPAKLPNQVLEIAQKEMLSHGTSGISVMEMSHRSSDFLQILNRAEANLREIMSIPDNYKVIFLQGGGTGLMAATAMNLIRLKPAGSADYLATGAWSAKAAKEAEKYGTVNHVLPATKKYTCSPDPADLSLDASASYVYYCDNETVHGIEYPEVLNTRGVPIVCDMSSNFMSKPVDFTKYGAVFAGAQKNVGCAGVTIVIIREDLIGFHIRETPLIFNFKEQVAANSLLNTPPCFSIYIMGLVFEWVKSQGGVKVMAERSRLKSEAIYQAIDKSNGFYSNPVLPGSRSRMNVVFRVGGPEGEELLEKRFLDGATKRGMVSLKGHRSVGGIRASLYNAVSVEDALQLASYMEEFCLLHH